MHWLRITISASHRQRHPHRAVLRDHFAPCQRRRLQVIFPTDATLTFAMQSPSGRQYTPAEIRDRTELVLQGRFARVLRAADVLAA